MRICPHVRVSPPPADAYCAVRGCHAGVTEGRLYVMVSPPPEPAKWATVDEMEAAGVQVLEFERAYVYRYDHRHKFVLWVPV